ncbi:MAG: DUF192 domain-containing protein [Peptococcales bacterium]
MQLLSVINVTNGIIIGDKIELADTYFARLKGLLGRDGLAKGQGMVLVPCNAIHCIGMKFAIDAIFLNRQKQVIYIRENMAPGTKAAHKAAYYVLEVASGIAQEKNIQIGDILGW